MRAHTELVIRDAEDADLRDIESLLVTSFPELFANACRGTEPSTVLDVLVELRRLNPRPVEGTIVATLDDHIVGTMRLQTAAMQHRVSPWARLAKLRPLGPVGALRFAAFAQASAVIYSPGPAEAYLRSACVAADHHSHGTGAEMLALLVDEAANRECSSASCVIQASNGASIRMVEKLGFAEIGVLPVPLARRFGTPRVELIFGRSIP